MQHWLRSKRSWLAARRERKRRLSLSSTAGVDTSTYGRIAMGPEPDTVLGGLDGSGVNSALGLRRGPHTNSSSLTNSRWWRSWRKTFRREVWANVLVLNLASMVLLKSLQLDIVKLQSYAWSYHFFPSRNDGSVVRQSSSKALKWPWIWFNKSCNK